MDYKQMTSPCGLDCSTCEIYSAYDGKDPRKVKPLFVGLIPMFSLMALFSKTSRTRLKVLKKILRIPKEEPLCRGCRNEHGKIPLLAEDVSCPMYACTKEKGFHNCSECPEFPCEHLYPKAFMAEMVPHNIKLINCCLIKKYGLETWAKDYAKNVKESYFKGELPIKV
jgi:hypothetical protein